MVPVGVGSARLAGWTAGLTAVGLGGFSLLYPDGRAARAVTHGPLLRRGARRIA